MMTLKKNLLLLGSALFLLTACGQSPEENIHNQLEETVALEEDFRAQQSGIVELEQREQEIYEEIITLGTEEMDRIVSLSEEALTINEERKEMLAAEKASIDVAKEAFQEIQSDFAALEEDAEEIAEEMYQAMEGRYQAYDDLYDAYTTSLSVEKELYTLLQEEELVQETLNEQITKVNESYEAIIAENEQFNTHTKKYNALRKDFYEAADINVTITEDIE